MRRIQLFACLAFALVCPSVLPALAQVSGPVNFVVLQVSFSDFPSGTRSTTAQTQTNFGSLGTLWGTHSSYGNISLKYQFAGPFQVASTSPTYLDIQSGQSSSTPAIIQLVNDAVAKSPKTINWANVYGVVVLFSDNRATGFYRGITLPGTTSISPPGGGTFNVHASIVGENPTETVTRAWGRWAHEMGHQMQNNPGNPWHPSNYNSVFEQMDGEYPAQSGMFNKQANMAYPGWMPPGKYTLVSPPAGASVGLLSEEQPPASQADSQAIKAFLKIGGPKLYYMVSVRHNVLGDDLADTHGPNGIPDNGVLIERVVEGGDPNIDDCPPNGCFRWVNVVGNGNTSTLWHAGDSFKSTTDGIFITVRQSADADHYVVDVAYADKAGQPDVGLNSWLEPPGNTYETTDIWFDSPLNGYGTFRYPVWSDLMGGTVPSGNGDDPAVGQVNRFYARIRNYGSETATNVVVHFDVTNPPGVGINGSNGFQQIGTVDQTTFPGLASIPPGKSVDVFINWTPNFKLTPAQIQAGTFFFHTCVRVRLDHVANETFFANQDGNGQQENILYFQAGSAGSPGAPGAPSVGSIRIKNDSPAVSKQFYLSVKREALPPSWSILINNGQPVVELGPAQSKDIPVKITQTKPEPIGSRHTVRVFAASEETLTNQQNPSDQHNEFKPLGGVDFQVAVLRHPKLICQSKGGAISGTLTGTAPKEEGLHVYISGINADGLIMPELGSLVRVANGKFQGKLPRDAARGVCLFAGSQTSASAGSQIFTN